MTRNSVTPDCAPGDHHWNIYDHHVVGGVLYLRGSCRVCGVPGEGETDEDSPDIQCMREVLLTHFTRPTQSF
jgi:hypothetical protein